MTSTRFDMRLLTYTYKFGEFIGVFFCTFKKNKIKYFFYKLYLLLSWCLIVSAAAIALITRIKISSKHTVIRTTVDYINFLIEIIFILVCRIIAFTQQKTYIHLHQSLTTLDRCLSYTNFTLKKANIKRFIARICIWHVILLGIHIRELIIKLKKGDYEFLLLALHHLITMYHQVVVFQFITIVNHILFTR